MRSTLLFIILLVTTFSIGCSRTTRLTGIPGEDGTDGSNGLSCAVVQLDDGANVVCEDGSVAMISNGQDGTNGKNGVNGTDGEDGLTSLLRLEKIDSVSASICPSESGLLVEAGLDSNRDSTLQAGEVNQTSIVCDGLDVEAPEYNIVETINPCGDDTTFNEILLRLANGTLVAYFAGSGGFLTPIPPGNYVTTDAASCPFTVNSDLSVTW